VLWSAENGGHPSCEGGLDFKEGPIEPHVSSLYREYELGVTWPVPDFPLPLKARSLVKSVTSELFKPNSEPFRRSEGC
jgi:hypothetical protein